MPISSLSRRSGALAALLFATSLLSCGREIAGPGGARWSGSLAVAPHFEAAVPFPGADVYNVAALVPFTKVRVIVQRNGATIASRVVSFAPTADSVALGLSVPLVSNDGDTLQVLLRYINAAGDTVFSGGPFEVTVFPGTSTNPTAVEMPVTYSGPGSQAVAITVTPDSVLALSGQSVPLTAVARDAQEAIVSNAVIGFISRDPARVVIPALGVGNANVVGARGTTYVIAQLVGGAMDSTKIVIDPRPTSLIIESGNGQATLQGTAFPQPLRVRVRASDNLGVANWPVNFAVTTGDGSVDSTLVHTDSAGYAQVIWTAGASAGGGNTPGSVTASIAAPALNVVFNGTQQSTAPTSMTYATHPNSITAGNAIDTVRVQVRNGAGEIIAAFNGPVTVALVNGTAGAQLFGTTSVNAVNGIAKFGDLTVDKQGNNYRLTATTAGVSATFSNPFNVAPAPASQRALFSGGGQSAAPSTALADSIVVRVTDQFGIPVAGVGVVFAVAQGGGSVSPVAGVTNAGGFAATQWTLGASGPQQITATAGALSPLAISATLIGGGPTVFFAGNDYTYIPAGQTRNLPIFLSSPSATAIDVAVSVQFDSITSVGVDTVTFAPGATRLDVPVTAGMVGQGNVYFTSSVGDDSVFVFVDSATVDFADIDWNQFTLGDTVRTVVLLSDPAPVGGVTVKVKSLNPSIALVAAADGEGVPIPACLSPSFCGGDLRADEPQTAPRGTGHLLGPLGDSANVFIPAGQRVGYVAAVIIALGGDGGENVIFEATANGFTGDMGNIFVDSLVIEAQSFEATLSTPFGIGQFQRIYLNHSTGSVVREHRFTLSSANPAIATVDTSAVIERFESYTHDIAVRGHAIGSTYIRYGLAGAALDSFVVNVGSPELDVEGPNSIMGEGESDFLRIHTTGPGAVTYYRRSTPLNFTVTSSDTSVLKVMGADAAIPAGHHEHYVPFRVVGPGTAYLIAQADGHAPDSMQISSTQLPLQFYTGAVQVGVGQFEEATVRIPSGFFLYGESKDVTITALNGSVVGVLQPVVTVSMEDSFIDVLYAGLAPGVDTLRLTTPGHPDFDLEITVLSVQLAMTTGFTVIDPDSAEFDVEVFVSDGVFAHPMMDSVFAILRSSNPSVVEVTDSIVTIAAAAEGAIGKFRGVAPGSATLTLEADGFDPGDGLNITVVPYQLTIAAASPGVGIRAREVAVIARNSPVTGAQDFTITQSGPGAVAFHALPDSFPAGQKAVYFNLVGVTVGTDTITISSPGHASATMIIVVDSVSLSGGEIWTEISAGYRDENVFGYLRLGESSIPRRAAEQLKFVVRSLDTLLAKVEQDTVIFEPDDQYPTQSAVVRYLDYGTVDLVVEDPLGILAPDTVQVDIGPRELDGYTSYDNDRIFLGMGQKADNFEIAVDRGFTSSDSLWVHLKASAEGVITIPDSVLILPGSYDAEIPVIAGDTVGSVRVEASVRGYNPWQFDVTVTRTVAEPYFDQAYVGGRNEAEVYFIDALTGYARPMATPVPMRFTTTMPGIVDTDVGTFNADTSAYYTEMLGPIGVSVGQTTVTVEDARVPFFGQIASGSAAIDVLVPYVELLRDVFQVGLGLTSLSGSNSFNVQAARDSIWVRFATSTSRAKVAPDSVLIVRDFGAVEVSEATMTLQESFTLTGDSLGVDTLTISADGFTGDYGIVSVEKGVLELANVPSPTVVIGDSTLVTLSLRDPSGGPAMAADVLQIIFGTDTNFVVSDGSTTVSTMNIPASATTVSFWVKAVNTGQTELVVTSPNFRTFRLRFTTRPLVG